MTTHVAIWRARRREEAQIELEETATSSDAHSTERPAAVGGAHQIGHPANRRGYARPLTLRPLGKTEIPAGLDRAKHWIVDLLSKE